MQLPLSVWSWNDGYSTLKSHNTDSHTDQLYPGKMLTGTKGKNKRYELSSVFFSRNAKFFPKCQQRKWHTVILDLKTQIFIIWTKVLGWPNEQNWLVTISLSTNLANAIEYNENGLLLILQQQHLYMALFYCNMPMPLCTNQGSKRNYWFSPEWKTLAGFKSA